MKTQHTPGPWSVDSDRAHNNLVVTCDDTGNAVAEVLSEQGDDPEAKANARLIAAAPTMFDLLTAADRLEELTGENLAVYARTFAALARAAIRKATGNPS